MNESTTTTVIETLNSSQQQQPNATVVTITLHPQPNDRENCDNISATAITPTSCESDTIERSQAIIKKSLKLDLTHSNNDDRIDEEGKISGDENLVESPNEKEDFKSPTSPKSPRNGKPEILSDYYFNLSMIMPFKMPFIYVKIYSTFFIILRWML